MSDNNFQVLKKNISLNEIENIEIYNKAVFSSEVKLNKTESRNSGNKVIPFDEKGESEVVLVTLDQFFSEKEDPDLIKIDVEGAQMDVLLGAEKILERKKLGIFLEVHPDYLGDYGCSEDELLEFLEDKGYSISFEQYREGTRLLALI